jgi:hypothetical protein
MRAEGRSLFGIVLSLALAAGVSLGLCALKEWVEKRPRPVAPPIARVR